MLDVGAMTTFGYVWLRLGAGEPEEVGEASLVTGQCGVDVGGASRVCYSWALKSSPIRASGMWREEGLPVLGWRPQGALGSLLGSRAAW
jgi:hypothetical protein